MGEIKNDTALNLKILGDYDSIKSWIEEFLLTKHISGVSDRTIKIYKYHLLKFKDYCDSSEVEQIQNITPSLIRRFLFELDKKGHNKGGIHIYYRTIKTFLLWYESDLEPENWKNPIRKVDGPRLRPEPLEPVSLQDVEKLIATCDSKTFFDLRDRGVTLFLFDTGVRASEACSVNLGDMDLIRGSVLIRHGKGNKFRTVFFGKKTRKAIREYLRIASNHYQTRDNNLPLWITSKGERLCYNALNLMIRRRAKKAGINKPGLHDFRRAFAINALRSGMDMETLRRLLGHSDYQCLQRYLREVTDDLRASHHQHSPVDNNL